MILVQGLFNSKEYHAWTQVQASVFAKYLSANGLDVSTDFKRTPPILQWKGTEVKKEIDGSIANPPTYSRPAEASIVIGDDSFQLRYAVNDNGTSAQPGKRFAPANVTFSGVNQYYSNPIAFEIYLFLAAVSTDWGGSTANYKPLEVFNLDAKAKADRDLAEIQAKTIQTIYGFGEEARIFGTMIGQSYDSHTQVVKNALVLECINDPIGISKKINDPAHRMRACIVAATQYGIFEMANGVVVIAKGLHEGSSFPHAGNFTDVAKIVERYVKDESLGQIIKDTLVDALPGAGAILTEKTAVEKERTADVYNLIASGKLAFDLATKEVYVIKAGNRVTIANIKGESESWTDEFTRILSTDKAVAKTIDSLQKNK